MYSIFALLVFTAQVKAKPHLLWKRDDSSTTSKVEKTSSRSTKSTMKQSVSTEETSSLTSQSNMSTTTVTSTLGPLPTFSTVSSLPTFFSTSPPTTTTTTTFFTSTVESFTNRPSHAQTNEGHRLDWPIIGGIVAAVLVFLIGTALLMIQSKRNKQRAKKRESTFDRIQHMPPSDIRQQPSLGIYRVTATYTPTLNDEMVVQMGDEIEVLVEYDDGWCQGINLSRDHIKGVFPQHCLDYSSRT